MSILLWRIMLWKLVTWWMLIFMEHRKHALQLAWTVASMLLSEKKKLQLWWFGHHGSKFKNKYTSPWWNDKVHIFKISCLQNSALTRAWKMCHSSLHAIFNYIAYSSRKTLRIYTTLKLNIRAEVIIDQFRYIDSFLIY